VVILAQLKIWIELRMVLMFLLGLLQYIYGMHSLKRGPLVKFCSMQMQHMEQTIMDFIFLVLEFLIGMDHITLWDLQSLVKRMILFGAAFCVIFYFDIGGLSEAFQAVHGFPLSCDFIMTDADGSIRNAAEGVWPNAKFLMCFFHLLKNVRKHSAGIPSSWKWKVIELDL
jgi:hypothetical protein